MKSEDLENELDTVKIHHACTSPQNKGIWAVQNLESAAVKCNSWAESR